MRSGLNLRVACQPLLTLSLASVSEGWRAGGRVRKGARFAFPGLRPDPLLRRSQLVLRAHIIHRWGNGAVHNATHSGTAVLLLAALCFSACESNETPVTPTNPSARGTDSLSGSNLAAQSSFCRGFNNAKAGPVSADITPPFLHLVVRAGPCSAPGQILGEQDGEVANVNAPAGPNQVTVSNRSDTNTAFTLRITYWH